jgi:XTP/dITP diphosphohydrolase
MERCAERTVKGIELKKELCLLTSKVSFPHGKIVFFVTTNIHKFNEALNVFDDYDVATALLRIKISEIQDEDIKNIAKTSAIEAAKKSSLPVIVEDSGLFIEELNGFPGPYSAYIFQTIGTGGILRLMKNIEKRNAYFHSVVSFCDPDGLLKCFDDKTVGRISRKERGSLGFGFDSIFEPYKTRDKTFAEMTIEDKNRLSHRAKTLRKFIKWYTSNF